MFKIFNILFFYNETQWQGKLLQATKKLYYYNEESDKIMNFYFINWFNEFKEEIKNETVRVVVRKLLIYLMKW